MSKLPNATLIDRINITNELIIVRVKPDAEVAGKTIDYQPGQYITLGLMGSEERAKELPPEETPPPQDKLIQRAYSIASSPTNKEYYEFYIAIVPTGALTSRLANLQIGDKLFLGNKAVGHFTLSTVPKGNNLILISTGTGLAPFVAMISSSDLIKDYGKVTLVHGVRKNTDFAYYNEIKEIQKKKSNLEYIRLVSRDSAEEDVHEGRVQKFFYNDSLHLNPEKDSVMLCGNPGMVEDIEQLLLLKGYTVYSKKNPSGTLHFEKYW